jgi:hypothetical protein
MAFHNMTGHNFKEIPYASQQAAPSRKSRVNARLISRALLSTNRRHNCGIIPTVISSPPPNPKSSCQVKLHLLVVLYMKDLIFIHPHPALSLSPYPNGSKSSLDARLPYHPRGEGIVFSLRGRRLKVKMITEIN